jgi:4-amino-4-deoxy-L-arabinose transferase-like glycosyltransferase
MSRPGSRTALIASAILILALAARVAEVQRTSYRPINDAGSYLTLASQVAHTGNYSNSHRSGRGAGGTRGPSAYFGPGFPYFLAAVDLIDGHAVKRGPAVHPARLAQAVLGTLTVAFVGLVALEAFGPMVAIVAALLAAVYPVLVELSGTLVAENLMTVLVLAAVWATLRARRAAGRRAGWIAAAGVLIGLGTLTHENAVLIAIPLAFGVWTGRPRRSWAALAAPALLVAVALATIAPWTIRNAIVMHRFIPVSDETGITLVGTYNAGSAADPKVPYKWRLYYSIPGERPLVKQAAFMTEPELDSRLQSQTWHYIRDHPLAPLAAAYHNTRRLLELEGQFAWRASAAAIDLPGGMAAVGVVSFWILLALALGGALTGLARGAPRWLWPMPVLLALSAVFVNVETPRFREPVDPFLILLAACGLVTAASLAFKKRSAAAAGLSGAPISAEGGPAARPAELVEMRQRLTGPEGHAG